MTGRLGDQAEIRLPDGYIFADTENTRRVLDETHNIPNGNELGTVAPIKGDWFAVFEFDAVGYVKDSEKDKLDANAILKSIQEGTEAANEERKKKGWETFSVTGWLSRPHYDDVTHQLTWCLEGIDSLGRKGANYRTRILGRRGVMSVELIAAPDEMNAVLPVFQSAATDTFSFTTDNRYASFVKGDKVAEYGLSALVVGGLAAAAVKTGFLKYILKILILGWKFVLIGFAALVGFVKKLFRGRAATSETGTASPSGE